MTDLRAVALGQHHHRAAGGLELLDVGVHPAGGGRPERAGRHALGRLGRPGVVDRVVARGTAGISSPASSRSLILACAMSRATTSGPVSESRVFTGCFDSSARISAIGRLRSMSTTRAAGDVLGDAGVGQVVRRVGLELLEEDALGGDLAERLPVGRAGHRDRDRAGGAVPGQPDHADVVAEVLAAELRADPEGLGELEDLLLELEVAEAVRGHRARGRQVVEVVRRGVLRGLERELRRRAADDDGQVVRRAGGRAERADLLVEELQHPRRVEDRLGLLEEEGLVRRAAALGHEQELVLRALPVLVRCRRRVELDLRGQVGAGVLLVPHRQRRELGVAQVELRVGVVHAAGDRLGVVGAGEHALGLLAHDDRGAGVLAHRQHAAGGDVDVLEQVERDEAVVARRLRVVDDPPQLGEVRGPQVVGDVVHRLGGQQPDRLGLDLEEGAARPPRTSRRPRSVTSRYGRVVRSRSAAGRSRGTGS